MAVQYTKRLRVGCEFEAMHLAIANRLEDQQVRRSLQQICLILSHVLTSYRLSIAEELLLIQNVNRRTRGLVE